jgi:hypothetical protein
MYSRKVQAAPKRSDRVANTMTLRSAALTRIQRTIQIMLRDVKYFVFVIFAVDMRRQSRDATLVASRGFQSASESGRTCSIAARM